MYVCLHACVCVFVCGKHDPSIPEIEGIPGMSKL